jgi:polyhydroxyalkanoate synthesis regulator phasin
MLDTLTLSKRLKAAGFSDAQADTLAEIQAQVVAENVASKDDVQALKGDIQALRADLRELETRLGGRIDTLESKMDGKFLLLQWMLGLVMGGVAALILKAFF